mgnify:CR=1 FL=1
MPRKIISEGKTTAEAIEKGLKTLKLSKENVEIKILENEEKRSFFSILTPRTVKVEITEKENEIKKEKNENKINKLTQNDIDIINNNISNFLSEFANKVGNINFTINIEENTAFVELEGETSKMLIGYRGETLNSLQTVISSIANKNLENKAKVIVNIADYREKRKKVLEDVAVKVAKTVIRTGKKITLEPMSAYERKIIHSKLQDHPQITTYSIGEEPYRKVVISKK